MTRAWQLVISANCLYLFLSGLGILGVTSGYTEDEQSLIEGVMLLIIAVGTGLSIVEIKIKLRALWLALLLAVMVYSVMFIGSWEYSDFEGKDWLISTLFTLFLLGVPASVFLSKVIKQY